MTDMKIENVYRTVEVDGAFGTSGSMSSSKIQREMESSGMDVSGISGEGIKESGFLDMLKSSIQEVNQHQIQSDHAISNLIAGRSKNIHETMLSVERADASLKLMMQVRNKIIDGYREIMRMQV